MGGPDQTDSPVPATNTDSPTDSATPTPTPTPSPTPSPTDSPTPGIPESAPTIPENDLTSVETGTPTGPSLQLDVESDFTVPSKAKEPTVSGHIWLAYTPDYVHLLANLQDNDHVQQGYDVWRGDAFQFDFAPHRTSEDGYFSEVNIGLHEEDGERVRYTGYREKAREAGPYDMLGEDEAMATIDRDSENNTTRYNVSIAWDALDGVSPKDEAIKTAIGLSDIDEDTGYGYLSEWGDGIFYGKDPTLFNTVRLG
jgi:hypothetical protein